MYGPPYAAAQVRLSDNVVVNTIAVESEESMIEFQDIFPGHKLVDCQGYCICGDIYDFEEKKFIRPKSPPVTPSEGESDVTS